MFEKVKFTDKSGKIYFGIQKPIFKNSNQFGDTYKTEKQTGDIYILENGETLQQLDEKQFFMKSICEILIKI